MKVVIDIDEACYKDCRTMAILSNELGQPKLGYMYEKIADGKPLEEESVLDKIKEELERQRRWLFKAGYNAHNVDVAFDTIKSLLKKVEVAE